LYPVVFIACVLHRKTSFILGDAA